MQNNTEHQSCIGENVTIVCSAIGRPIPDVLLYHNGTFIRRNSSSFSHPLFFNSSSTFGSYICVSNNSVGMANITTKFKIKRKSFVEYSSLLLEHKG